MKKTKIIIVDDNELFRKGLKFFLENECNMYIIAEAYNGVEFLELKEVRKADVVLMDISMPEKDGYKTTLEATNNYYDLKVIAVTAFQEKAYIKLILESGFKGCVFKNQIFEEIEKAIEGVMSGQYYMPDNIKI